MSGRHAGASKRRITSAESARAYAAGLAASSGGSAPPFAQIEEWFRRDRERSRGLPFLQLVSERPAQALAQGALEFFALVFVPERAPVGEGFLVWGTLALTEGRLYFAELSLAPQRPEQASLNGRALRLIRLSPLLARAHAELASSAELASLARQLGWEDSPTAEEQAELARAAANSSPKRRPPGRPSLGDQHYARIAHAYLDLQAQGYGRGIIRALAEQEQRPWQTIRDWVAKARKRGFLSAGQQGRAGALPGPQLRDYHPENRPPRPGPASK